VWWANLPEPWGRRPLLLLARDQAYTLLSYVLAAPLTTRIRDLPTTVRLDPTADYVPDVCVVNLDMMQLIRIAWLDRYLTHLSLSRMGEIERAIHFALDLSS
jgi:mRNA interferase MazF